jgi:hypothetical protein
MPNNQYGSCTRCPPLESATLNERLVASEIQKRPGRNLKCHSKPFHSRLADKTLMTFNLVDELFCTAYQIRKRTLAHLPIVSTQTFDTNSKIGLKYLYLFFCRFFFHMKSVENSKLS